MVRKIEGIAVPGPQCALTSLPWGSAGAISRLRSMLASTEAEWSAYENAPVGQSYDAGQARVVLSKLGSLHETLGLHLQIQAQRAEDRGYVTVMARG